MKPVEIEIIYPLITALGLNCRGCNLIFDEAELGAKFRDCCNEGLPDEWKQSLLRLRNWIQQANELYKHRIQIRLIDAQSLLGLWKQIRYRLFQMPAFILSRKITHVGWDTNALEDLIDRIIKEEAAFMGEKT